MVVVVHQDQASTKASCRISALWTLNNVQETLRKSILQYRTRSLGFEARPIAYSPSSSVLSSRLVALDQEVNNVLSRMIYPSTCTAVQYLKLHMQERLQHFSNN
jgi:hypothetical protein